MSASPAKPRQLDPLRIEVLPELARVSAAEWDRLLDVDDAPLLSFGYLQGLEVAGCVGPGTGWHPAHLLIRRQAPGAGPEGELVAAAPAYLKTDSDGEWVHDLDWATFAEQHGLGYYPKLVLAVPFNPVTGGRLLTRPDLPAAERTELEVALLRGAQAVCQRAGLSSTHVLFPRANLLPSLRAAGFAPRRQEQYHFLNQGYRSFEDFLARLTPHRRTSIRRERRAVKDAGIQVRTHRGLECGPESFTPADLSRMYDLHHLTSVRYTEQGPYLNRRFYHLCAERLGDRLELVLARRGDEIIGGAFNLRGDRRLFGRYWGEAEHVPFLHFEVCFYHSMERCIAEGFDAFEPGHGGEQKLNRGFWPVATYSAHHLRDVRLRQPIEGYLKMESRYVDASLKTSRERSPLRKKPADPFVE